MLAVSFALFSPAVSSVRRVLASVFEMFDLHISVSFYPIAFTVISGGLL
ncbi:hypothetical protein COLO4_24059 [Corchorus olitorius]|uniref:Uncharacterized protein n=1 Tax=Corchorus olitorius TaxID=93759 RepID=A0A1R3ID25_9ROSI|nr:hypothetical protein COLO4_24059 [Corchorus olitorius]